MSGQGAVPRITQGPSCAGGLVLLWKWDDDDGAKQKFLEILDLARRKFLDEEYLRVTIAWPPK